MPRIHVLPQSLITAIAAGEVAERPAVILKELLENSLDAGATEIEVELHQAGMRYLRVTDNGQGMTGDELALAILRHTTSKISAISDLEKILTFGFRGEALASITAVADVTLISRPPNQTHANQLIIKYGETGDVVPIAGAPGTTVVVQYPFAHLPARRKFLNDSSREWRAVAQTLTQLVIAHPEVSWHITHNHRPIWHLPVAEPFARLQAVLGIDQPQLIAPLQVHHDWLQLTGWLGHPQLARSTQTTQYFFVNKRPVSWPIANRRVKAAFGQLLEARLEPFFSINIDLAPELIDVNVHPQKSSVKFIDEPQVLTLLHEAIQHTLQTTFHPSRPAQVLLYPLANTSSFTLADHNRLPASPTTSSALAADVERLPTLLTTLNQQEIWQFDKTYLLTMTSHGILLFDQHAAHERILFEKLLSNYQTKDQKDSQQLNSPAVINLDLRDTQLLEENLETLTKLGFEVTPFGPQVFHIAAVPRLLADRDPVHIIKELLDDCDEGKTVSLVDSAAERTIAYLSCRNAVKAGDVLEPAQRLELINQLSACKNPQTCPHRRPTNITLTIEELEKRFHRT